MSPNLKHSQIASPAMRVLVAEDSSITQDLLKLVLTQQGHEVDIVGDGTEALNALRQQVYDVALLDFHLPELDGVEVVSIFLETNGDRPRPRFVAITADVEGLLAHKENCEYFDKVVPKPVDIQEICGVISETREFENIGLPKAQEAQPSQSRFQGNTVDLWQSNANIPPHLKLNHRFFVGRMILIQRALPRGNFITRCSIIDLMQSS